jgi:hypothetical protein
MAAVNAGFSLSARQWADYRQNQKWLSEDFVVAWERIMGALTRTRIALVRLQSIEFETAAALWRAERGFH